MDAETLNFLPCIFCQKQICLGISASYEGSHAAIGSDSIIVGVLSRTVLSRSPKPVELLLGRKVVSLDAALRVHLVRVKAPCRTPD